MVSILSRPQWVKSTGARWCPVFKWVAVSCKETIQKVVSSDRWSLINYTPRKEVRGGILDSPCSSVRLSVCLSVRPSGKKEKKNCHLYNTILSLFISRHYKKSLLRSQIYHGYEELSTDINYPIWRRQKLPYMKKTRKKKQVCGAACFMAAEIKFSEDVRGSVSGW